MTLREPQTAPQRRGLSLIEMLVVITLSAMVLGIVVSFTASLIQWDRRTRNAGLASNQLATLASTLRNDIRRATDATLQNENKQVMIVMPDGNRAEYTCDREGCQRRLLATDDTTLRYDHYSIGAASDWRIEQLPPGRRTLVAITLNRASSDDAAAKRPPLLVYGALSADLPPAVQGGDE